MNQVVELPARTGAMVSGGAVKAIVPQNIDDAFRLSNMIVKSGMAPSSFKTPEAVLVAIMHGMEVGLPPLMALQSIAVINNRPTLWGDGAMALVRATGQLEEFEEWIDGANDNMIAYCKIKRRGEKPVTHSFSVADAKKAGLWGKQGPWTTYPRRMIAMRPRSWCLRDVFADALKGLHIAEEVMDTDMKNVTPPSPPPAPSVAASPHIETVQSAPEIEVVNDATSKPLSEVVSDWIARLNDAPRDIQEEIFESEIDPFREKGQFPAADYNALLALVKDA